MEYNELCSLGISGLDRLLEATKNGKQPLNRKVEEAEIKKAIYQLDFKRYAKENLWITTTQGGIKQFGFNFIQRRLYGMFLNLGGLKNPIRIIVLKARQMGLTTFWEAMGFWRCTLWPYSNGLVAANDEITTKVIFNIPRLFLQRLPDCVRPKIEIQNKKEGFIFGEPSPLLKAKGDYGLQSRLMLHTGANLNLGAGQTLHYVHLSEVGRYDYGEDLRSAINPAIHDVPGTIMVMESTAKGAKTFFHNEWLKAKASKGSFNPIFFPWYENEEYVHPNIDSCKLTPEEEEWRRLFRLTYGQIRWRRKKIEDYQGDEDRFRENYPIDDQECWLTSGRPLYPRAKVIAIRQKYQLAPLAIGEMLNERIFVTNSAGALIIWEHPKRECKYVLASDVAEGLPTSDNSTIEVLELETCRQVAEYCAKVDELTLAEVIHHVGRYYNNALCAVETRGPGKLTMHELAHKWNYPNLYTRVSYESINAPVTKRLGWDTNVSTKPKMIALSRLHINRTGPPIRSKWLLDEIEGIVDEGRASTGSTDDRWIAWMIALSLAYNEDSTLRGENTIEEEEKEKVIEYTRLPVFASDVMVKIGATDKNHWQNL